MSLLIEGLARPENATPKQLMPVPSRENILDVISYAHKSPHSWDRPLTLVYPDAIGEHIGYSGSEMYLEQEIAKDNLQGRVIAIEAFDRSPFTRLGIQVQNPESAVSIIIFREGFLKDAMFQSKVKNRFARRYGGLIPRTANDVFMQGVIAEKDQNTEFNPVAFDLVNGRRLGLVPGDQEYLQRQRNYAEYYFTGVHADGYSPIATLISRGVQPKKLT